MHQRCPFFFLGVKSVLQALCPWLWNSLLDKISSTNCPANVCLQLCRTKLSLHLTHPDKSLARETLGHNTHAPFFCFQLNMSSSSGKCLHMGHNAVWCRQNTAFTFRLQLYCAVTCLYQPCFRMGSHFLLTFHHRSVSSCAESRKRLLHLPLIHTRCVSHIWYGCAVWLLHSAPLGNSHWMRSEAWCQIAGVTRPARNVVIKELWYNTM